MACPFCGRFTYRAAGKLTRNVNGLDARGLDRRYSTNDLLSPAISPASYSAQRLLELLAQLRRIEVVHDNDHVGKGLSDGGDEFRRG